MNGMKPVEASLALDGFHFLHLTFLGTDTHKWRVDACTDEDGTDAVEQWVGDTYRLTIAHIRHVAPHMCVWATGNDGHSTMVQRGNRELVPSATPNADKEG